MRRIRQRAAHYLRDELFKHERITVLALNAQRKIVSINRSTSDWRLTGLYRGSDLPESLNSLLDSAHTVDGPAVFRYVEFDGYIVDIHVLGDEKSAEIVLHDVTEAHAKEQTLQQRAHENSLLSDQQVALNAELADLNQELLLRRRQAEKASEAKSRFIASMSHEFRSPIASIMGYADLLEAELPESDNPQALQRASWHLLTLVENLLEQAREGEKNVPLNPTRFSLDRLVNDIKALFQMQADAKSLGFSVEFSPVGIEIELDELRLRQILINLVSNALRYTTQGQVDIRLLHRDETLFIRVRDTGRGIAAEDMEKIFEPFTHVGDGGASGTGLGLTITRQLVKRMGGKLEIDSKPGVGSEFRVNIPCLQVSGGHTTVPVMTGKVLWVDDDQDILGLYRVLLEDWGLQVYTASSVDQAKEMMKRHSCPVVVTDMHLTDGDGLELMRHFWAKQPEVEGIIISGSGIVELAPETMTSGIRAFLQKPIDHNVLGTELAAAFAKVTPDHAV
jgi:signal transduction histidine kinase/ActR/RegA family two-component response regulator